MIDIIKTYADDLSGNRQRREQCDLVEIDGRSFLEHRYCPVECGAAFLDENIKRAGIACVSAQQAMELSIKASNCKPFPFSAAECGKSHEHYLSFLAIIRER
jgi:hypothetical protein